MHQDQRVGLALGILLIGACAALFFRNETPTSSKTPQLQHAQELDDRIAERSTRPYLKGIQAVETADKRAFNQSADPAHSLDDQNEMFSSDSADRFARSKQPRFHRPGARPSDVSGDVLELAPINIPSDGRSNGDFASGTEIPARDSSSNIHLSHPRSMDSGLDARQYVVQKGDTLSSIATKTLGHSGRFQELFDANQDQLHDPNDVKIGMILRIPNGRDEASHPAHGHKANPSISRDPEPSYVPMDTLNDSAPPVFESNSRSATERRNSSTELLPPDVPNTESIEYPSDSESLDDSGGKKFVPARRVPLPGRPAGPQTKREPGGRKLSQATLQSTSGKVAR